MIEVGENYAVGSNSLNVILYEKHPEKKILWREIGYFNNPQNALEHLIDLDIRKTELKDLKTVCNKVEELRTLIHSLDLPRLVVACDWAGKDKEPTPTMVGRGELKAAETKSKRKRRYFK